MHVIPACCMFVFWFSHLFWGFFPLDFVTVSSQTSKGFSWETQQQEMSFISCLETWRSDRYIFPNSRYGYPRGGYHITGVSKKLSRNITSVRRWTITNLFLKCMFCILAFLYDYCVHLLLIQIKFLCLIIWCLYAKVSMYNFKIKVHAEKRTHGNGMQHITVHA